MIDPRMIETCSYYGAGRVSTKSQSQGCQVMFREKRQRENCRRGRRTGMGDLLGLPSSVPLRLAAICGVPGTPGSS